MDFKTMVDSVSLPCCVFSVEKTPMGTCGEIRVVCANEDYITIMGPNCTDDGPYFENAPKNERFEDLCFRAAHKNERMHAFVNTRFLGAWTDQLLIPLKSDSDTIGYCQFIFEFIRNPETDRFADFSLETAALVLKSCLNLVSTEDFEENIGKVTEDIMGASEAEIARIMLFNSKKREAVTLCEQRKHISWRMGIQGDYAITVDHMLAWNRLLVNKSCLAISNEEEMKEYEPLAPQWIESMRAHNVKNTLLVPLRRAAGIIGYIVVFNYNIRKTEPMKEMFEIISLFLSAEIANHLLFLEMKTMSDYDELTGLKNRHAMRQDAAKSEGLGQGVPFGIITMDVNGLKAVNDAEGHIAGDKLIIRTAMMLTDKYGHEFVYRLGGDEFILIIPEVSRSEFERKIQDFHAYLETKPNISISFGTVWYPGEGNVEEAFHQADLNMYENKRTFYKNHPELRQHV